MAEVPASPTRSDAPTARPTRQAGLDARLLLLLVLPLVGVVVNLSIWTEIVHIARSDPEASHILLVPAVFAWLVWTRREVLKAGRFSPSLLGPVVIALGGLVSWMGFNHAIQSFWHGGAVLVLVGTLVTALGHRVGWGLWPALLVLVFLVPVPGTLRQQLGVPLQAATASLTQVFYDFIAIDVTRHGNVLNYRGQAIAVAEACNGMRMVFALLLVCYAVAFAQPLRPGIKLMILVLSPIVALGCNVLRLIPSVWFYGYDPDTAGPIFHDLSGWGMILLAFALVMGFVRLLEWLELPVKPLDSAPL